MDKDKGPSEVYLFRLVVYVVASFLILILLYTFLTYIPLSRTVKVVRRTGRDIELVLRSACGIITEGSVSRGFLTLPVSRLVAPRTVSLCQELLNNPN